jgi:uncharacterized membrane protein YesL
VKLNCPRVYIKLIRRFLQLFKKKYIMKRNMGNADRTVRVIVAAIMAVLYFTGTIGGTLGLVLLALAGIFVFISLINFCPLYYPFKISTYKKK